MGVRVNAGPVSGTPSRSFSCGSWLRNRFRSLDVSYPI